MMISIKVPKWNVKELCGYEPMTTFWEDFSVAERFGCDAISANGKATINT